MRLAVIFGGAGYIGSFLIQKLVEVRIFDKIVIYDIRKPGTYTKFTAEDGVHFIYGDVRNEIALDNIPEPYEVKDSWIFNLAAVHREPGHDYKEYFDTNIPGAENINNLARKTGIQNIFFTSSIAPYGKSLHKRTESSTLYPETAYGISKAMAEQIHKQWLAENDSRRLIIVRPSVIFGPKDPGNVYRMIKALKKGTFVLPNGGKVIKAYGYVFGLVDSMVFTMNKKESLIIYNYAETPLEPLNEMANIVKREFKYNKPTLKLSVNLLSVFAFFTQIVSKVTGRKTDIHPVRVRKAGFPTNIEPKYLLDHDFDFKYDFRRALKHWKSVSMEDF